MQTPDFADSAPRSVRARRGPRAKADSHAIGEASTASGPSAPEELGIGDRSSENADVSVASSLFCSSVPPMCMTRASWPDSDPGLASSGVCAAVPDSLLPRLLRRSAWIKLSSSVKGNLSNSASHQKQLLLCVAAQCRYFQHTHTHTHTAACASEAGDQPGEDACPRRAACASISSFIFCTRLRAARDLLAHNNTTAQEHSNTVSSKSKQ